MRRRGAYPSRHPMSEVRAVDDDQRIGLARNDGVSGLADATQNEGQPGRDGGKPVDGKLIDWEQSAQAAFRHCAAADTGKYHWRRRQRLQGGHQSRTETVTRFLAGSQKNTHSRGVVGAPRALAIWREHAVHADACGASRPTTNRPVRSATSIRRCGSATMVVRAATAMPARPARAARVTVSG